MYDTNDVEDLKFKQLPNTKIALNNDYYDREHQPIQTIAISNIYGLTFIATVRTVRIFNTKDLVLMQPNVPKKDNIPAFSLNLDLSTNFANESSFECVNIGLNSDDSILAINIVQVETHSPLLSILFYDIRQLSDLLCQQVKDYSEIASYTVDHLNAGNYSNLLWNPTIPNCLAFLCTKLLKISLFNKNDTYFSENIPFDYNKEITSVCWSPKGKQLLGGTENGDILQIKTDFSIAKTIPAPVLDHLNCTSITPINLTWISTYSILCCYQIELGSEDEISFVFVHIYTNKDSSQPPIYRIYEDPYYDTKRTLQASRTITMNHENRLLWLFHLGAWKNIVIGVSNDDPEIFTFAPDDDSNDSGWSILGVEDVFRAVLPVCEADGQNVEMFPTGAAIDFTSSCHVLFPRSVKYPPSPILFVMTDAGILCAFSIVATWPDVPSLNLEPQSLGNLSIIADAKTQEITEQIPVSLPKPVSDVQLSKNVVLPSNAMQSNLIDDRILGSESSALKFPPIDDQKMLEPYQPELFKTSAKPLQDTKEFNPLHLKKTGTTHHHALPNNYQSHLFKADTTAQGLSASSQKLIASAIERMNSLKISTHSHDEGNSLPPFITLPAYLAAQQKSQSLLTSKLAGIDKLIAKMGQEIDVRGKERLLDTFTLIELVRDVIARGKTEKDAFKNPSIHKPLTAKESNVATQLADGILYQFNERYRELVDSIYKVREKINLKLDDYAMENIDLMKRLKIPDEAMTYRCLKTNATIIVQLSRECDQLLARYRHHFPTANFDLPAKDEGYGVNGRVSRDKDNNPNHILLNRIFEKLKRLKEDTNEPEANLNATSNRGSCDVRPQLILGSVCSRVATLKVRDIDWVLQPLKDTQLVQYDFDQLLAGRKIAQRSIATSSKENNKSELTQKGISTITPVQSESSSLKAALTMKAVNPSATSGFGFKLPPPPYATAIDAKISTPDFAAPVSTQKTFSFSKMTQEPFSVSRLINADPSTFVTFSNTLVTSSSLPHQEETLSKGAGVWANDGRDQILGSDFSFSRNTQFTPSTLTDNTAIKGTVPATVITALPTTATPTISMSSFITPTTISLSAADTSNTAQFAQVPTPAASPTAAEMGEPIIPASSVETQESVDLQAPTVPVTSLNSVTFELVDEPSQVAQATITSPLPTITSLGDTTTTLPDFNFNLGTLPPKSISPFSAAPSNPFVIKSIPSQATSFPASTATPSSGFLLGSTFGFGAAQSPSAIASPFQQTNAPNAFGVTKPVFGGSALFGSGLGASPPQAPPSQSHLFGAAPVFGAASPFAGFGWSAPSNLLTPPTQTGGFGFLSVSTPNAVGFDQKNVSSPSFAALAQMGPTFGSFSQQPPALSSPGFGFGAVQPTPTSSTFGCAYFYQSFSTFVNRIFHVSGFLTTASVAGFGAQATPAFVAAGDTGSLGNSFMAYR